MGGGERAKEVRRAGGRWGGLGGSVQRESREGGTERGAETGGRGRGAQVRVGRERRELEGEE